MEFQILPEPYGSPRWSGEFRDCSMPMTFDQHSNCGYSCSYCFAGFQRALGGSKEKYLKREVKKVSVDKFKRIFLEPDSSQFAPIVKNRMVMQWGGMSDPMCPIEEQTGTGLEILKFLNEQKYPFRISSKTDLPLRDDRYMRELEIAGKDGRVAYMASIITYDDKCWEKLEAGTPHPKRRMETLGALAKLGVWTVLRLRPYVVGVTDRTVKEIFEDAGRHGVHACSTEFFCLEARANEEIKARYKNLSECCGFDVFQFYKKFSNTQGYLRLSKKFSQPYMDELVSLARKHNIKLASSDPKHKDVNFSYSCCGLPNKGPLGNTHRGEFQPAIQLAKIKGFVTWDDVEKVNILRSVRYRGASGLNTGSGERLARFGDMSLSDLMKEWWNNPKHPASQYKEFEGILTPKGVDAKGNVVYIYKGRTDYGGFQDSDSKPQPGVSGS